MRHVLLTCHSLANLDGDIIGDPLEKVTLHALEWTVSRGDSVGPLKGKAARWQIYQRYHFSSALKRMSVIAGQSSSPSSNDITYIVSVKGAPETLKPMVGGRSLIDAISLRGMKIRRMISLHDRSTD